VDPAVNGVRHGRIRYEPQYFRQFLSSIRSGNTVYDIGANQGLFTVAAALRTGARGRVYAFEPAPASLQVLTRQIALNNLAGIAVPVNSLVGGETHPAIPFHVAETAAGWASAAYAPPGTAPILAGCVTIDAFAAATGRDPHVIKIDVEGLELDVLSGAAGVLRRARPAVFCALHPQLLNKRGSSSTEVLELMRSNGYSARDCRGRSATEVTTEVVFLPAERSR
jgi:FkbM family methyltransferase